MARWLCLLLTVFAFAGLLASTPGVTSAAPLPQHDCCPGTMSAHQAPAQPGSGHDHATLPQCCVIGFCACAFAMPAPAGLFAIRTVAFSFADAIIHWQDRGRAGQSRPPDLRPPIA